MGIGIVRFDSCFLCPLLTLNNAIRVTHLEGEFSWYLLNIETPNSEQSLRSGYFFYTKAQKSGIGLVAGNIKHGV